MREKNTLKIVRSMVVLFLSIVISYFFAMSEKWWMPVSALFVMRAPTGSLLRYGLRRYLMIAFCIVLASLVEKYFLQSSFTLMYMRLSDVTLGAVLGILANLLLWPIKPDVEFRQEMRVVLKAYVDYVIAIKNLMLHRQNADKEKQDVDNIMLQHMPVWVYEPGFNVALRQGHRHFLVMVERAGQLLFSMHHAARYEFDESVRLEMSVPLEECTQQICNMLSVIITVLNLEKTQHELEDFDSHLAAIEKIFQSSASPALELLDVSTDYSYFAAFVYDLRDLRLVLLSLLSAVRV